MQRSSLGVLVLLIVVGCKADRSGESAAVQLPKIRLSDPEQLTLFSIDGRASYRREDTPVAVDEFHGYPVLGKIEITDPEKRRELIAALKDAVARRPEYGAKCFHPRHG